MNYVAHYDRLVARARDRILVGYRERHHVVPKCMDGGNEPTNIVELTAEEHYVAHQLLVKIYQKNKPLAHAALLMAKRVTGNKAYGWLRRRHADSIRGSVASIETRTKQSAAHRGKPHSEEHVVKVAAANRGKHRSLESRANISAARLGKKFGPLSLEHRAKLSESKIGNKHCLGRQYTAETRAKITAANLDRWERHRRARGGA